jgi:DNA invertase Pin-like site-specific DNA recombinase
MMSDTPVKLASAYIRCGIADETSVAEQLRICRERAAELGYSIPDEHVFVDNGVSGASTTRPAFDRLKEVITSGGAPFDRLYIRDHSRLCRSSDPRMSDYHAVDFEQHGVELTCCGEWPTPANAAALDNDIGLYLSQRVEDVFAAHERQSMVRRLQLGKEHRARSGFFPWAHAPYGLVRVEVEPTTHEVLRVIQPHDRLRLRGALVQLRPATDGSAEIVRGIFQALEQGQTARAVAKALNTGTVLAPGRTRPWRAADILRIAQNRIYMGTFVWVVRRRKQPRQPGDESTLVMPGFMKEPLVTREQFEAVQQRLAPHPNV